MKLNKFKKLLLSFVVDFLIADYSSWEIFETFNINPQKLRDWSLKVRRKYTYKKIIN